MGGFQRERPTTTSSSSTTTAHTPLLFTRKQNHPNSYQEHPSFKGPLLLPRSSSTAESKKRISYYWYHRNHINPSNTTTTKNTDTTATTTICTEEDEDEEDEQQQQQQQQQTEENIQPRPPLRWLQLQYLSSQQQQQQGLTDVEQQQGRPTPVPVTPLSPHSTTQTILKRILEQFIVNDAPIDAKEVAESMEFYLRTSKRLLGRAKRRSVADGTTTITVYDLCAGHGLTGMLFAACNPPRRTQQSQKQQLDGGGVGEKSSSTSSSTNIILINVVLVDQTEPPAHQLLKECIMEICPWVAAEAETEMTIREHRDADDHNNNNYNRKNSIQFVTATVEEFTASCRRTEEEIENNNKNNSNNNSDDHNNLSLSATATAAAASVSSLSSSAEIVISTHACGSLTDRVLEFCTSRCSTPTTIATATTTTTEQAQQQQEPARTGISAVAVMPCCYTGTDATSSSSSSDGNNNGIVVPFGVRRLLGVSMSADLRRSMVLQQAGYHVDFAAIPSEITPMNRIIVGEKTQQ